MKKQIKESESIDLTDKINQLYNNIGQVEIQRINIEKELSRINDFKAKCIEQLNVLEELSAIYNKGN
jgi:hypothetical protein